MANILIIDDNIDLTNSIERVVKKLYHSPTSTNTLSAGIEEAESGKYDLVLLDVMLPDGDGKSAITKIMATPNFPEIIVMTGAGSHVDAEFAIKKGALDYLMKPFNFDTFSKTIQNALQFREEKFKRHLLSVKLNNVVGKSALLKEVLEQAAIATSNNVNVHIMGETGTGKELIARTIHENSSRADKNFVTVDCASLPESLLESILFGYVKGAFTGAAANREGLIEQADGGTLFLDEIGELPLSAQKSLLRVLQERRFIPVGGREEKKCDFRLISATNKNIEQMVENGQFREDLLYRINSHAITIPPLRERPEDIPELTLHYIARYCELYHIEPKEISYTFQKALLMHNWPGNVRELVNVIDRVLAVARNESKLFHYHLPMYLRVKIAQLPFEIEKKETKSSQHSTLHPPLLNENLPLPQFREYIEVSKKHYFNKLMEYVKYNKEEAAIISGLSISRIYALLNELNII